MSNFLSHSCGDRLNVLAHHTHLQSPRLSRAEGTHALVIAPTRELCLQIHDVAMLLLKKYYWLVSCAAPACALCACQTALAGRA